jgi:D-alanyl-D-alanine carboxypeptidase (penicillin-binding protein 5/6)
MMPLSVRQGRRRALLLLVSLFIVVSVVLVGVAQAHGASLQLQVDPQTSSITVAAKDLGGFASNPPAVSSASAMVVNLGTGKVLYQKNAQARRPMASTTKMMTALLVLENMEMGTELTVSPKAAQTWEKDSWVKAGDVLTVEQLLYALMVASSNQAGVVLAEGCSGSVEAFVQLMNARAGELGLAGTHYTNPHGLDGNGHYSTAADLVTLARYALNDEVFRSLAEKRTYTIQIPGHDTPTTFQTTNELLANNDWVTGVKTGETPLALSCLVATGTKDGISILSVVLGQPDHAHSFVESERLLEYGFSQYRYVVLAEQETPLAEAAIPYHLDERFLLVPETAVGRELYKDESLTATVFIDGPLVLPVEAGEVFGRIEVSVDGSSVSSVDLIASSSFGKTTLGTKIAYYLTRFGRWVKGS